MKTQNISGINITAFKQNEALINCRFTLSFSDAMDLCAKTTSGLYLNRDLQEWFIDKIAENLKKVIDEKNESTIKNTD